MTGVAGKRLHSVDRIILFETQKQGIQLQKDDFSYRTIAKPAEGFLFNCGDQEKLLQKLDLLDHRAKVSYFS